MGLDIEFPIPPCPRSPGKGEINWDQRALKPPADPNISLSLPMIMGGVGG